MESAKVWIIRLKEIDWAGDSILDPSDLGRLIDEFENMRFANPEEYSKLAKVFQKIFEYAIIVRDFHIANNFDIKRHLEQMYEKILTGATGKSQTVEIQELLNKKKEKGREIQEMLENIRID